MKTKYNTVYSYIGKEILVSFLVSFLFFFFMFFINQILLIAEKILSKKVPILDVIILLIYYLPDIISLTLPFSALVGTLMALGRLSSDNEVLALRASGVSILRIFLPVIVLSVVFTLVSFVFNDYFLSLGHINIKIYSKRLIYNNPGLELEAYSAKRYEDKVIVTGNVEGNRIEDVIIFDKTAKNEKRVITAKTAYLLENTEQSGVISLKLMDVFSHVMNPAKTNEYEYASASELVYNILVRNIIGNTPNDFGPREMSSVDVWKEITEKQGVLDERKRIQIIKIEKLRYEITTKMQLASAVFQVNQAMVYQYINEIRQLYGQLERENQTVIDDKTLKVFQMEFFRKFSHPFSCIVFMIFAFPVALMARRSGRLIGFFIGVIISVLYWIMLFISYRMGPSTEISTFVIIWFPNFVILVLGMAMYLFRMRR
ncbi:MAG: LptF/LptG family permease [Spirochaetales bacterium]|nr:LptF/LptG family permease [Spirochaetales bacterium]